MKITNPGLPIGLFEALCNREYSNDGADRSVTELIDSPRACQLKRRHDSEIEMSADALLASFLGTSFHNEVARLTKTGAAERRLFLEVNGWKISGGMDHYHDGVLSDYKTCSTFKVGADAIPDGRIEEFENQLNVYAHILRANGFEVKKLMIFALFKDWNAGMPKRAKKIFVPYVQGGTPEKAWAHFEVTLWTPEQAEAYVLERVKLHQKAEALPSESLPLCTQKELWNGKRCKSYCGAAPFCNQHLEQSKTGLLKREDESA